MDTPTKDQFLKHLRDALIHLHDPAFLRRSPLAKLFGVGERFDTPSVLGRILTDAIRALEPPPAEALAVTPEGVWAALADDRAVALLDTATGRELRRIPIDANAYALAADGPDLWVADFEGDQVLRLDRVTGDVLSTVTGIVGPTGVTVGEGGVWVIANGNGRIVRIDPATNEVDGQAILSGREAAVIRIRRPAASAESNSK